MHARALYHGEPSRKMAGILEPRHVTFGASTMTITLNGRPKEIQNAITVEGFLRDLDLEKGAIAIAINGVFVPRSEHKTHMLKTGDQVELVAPMQGG